MEKKTTLVSLCSKDIFSNQLKLERKRKELREKKKRVSEKLDKNLQEILFYFGQPTLLTTLRGKIVICI